MVLVRTNRKKAVRKEAALDSSGITRQKGRAWWMLGIISFFLGIAGGAVFFCVFEKDANGHLYSLLESDLEIRLDSSFGEVFLSSLSSSFVMTLACVLAGLSVWGILCLPFFPLIRGFGLGLVAGCLCTAYGGQGVVLYLTAFLPGALLSAGGILLASKESWDFSRRLFRGFLHPKDFFSRLSIYATRLGLSLVPCLLGALIDSLAACICAVFLSL